MFAQKLLLLLAMTMVSGTLAGTMTVKKTCIPCTAYCKTHPNAPQCN